MDGQHKDIFERLAALLHYQRLLGIKGVPNSSEVERFLQYERPPGKGAGAQREPLENAFSSGEEKSQSHVVSRRAADTLEEIRDEVEICTGCALHHQRIHPVAGKGGGSEVKLFIVGGWLLTRVGEDPHIFGREEDRMLARMIEAIHLTPGEVFISNVVKCAVDRKVQPRVENIEACISYLKRQIALTSPAVICTMGHVATRSLLAASKPLSQLRGRFHSYELSRERIIPVMPTYHPTFLLENPEMKRATWEDLQRMEKHLAG